MSIKQNGGVFGRNPTFNDVTIDGTLTFDGDIDINSDLKVNGEIEAQKLIVAKNDQTNGAVIDITNTFEGSGWDGGDLIGSVDFKITDTSTPQKIRAAIRAETDSSVSSSTYPYRVGVGVYTSNLAVLTKTAEFDYLGNLKMNSGNGIDFSATSGTGTSELLNDYEEGTWTPAFSGGDYTFTYNKQKGSYTKIGNRVYVDMVLYVHPTTAPSGSTDGNLSVTGLPYAFNKQNDVESVGGIVTFKQLFLPAIETVATRLSDTGTSFLLYSTLATNYPDSGFAQASNVGANARIRIQFSYPTNG
jgi:hypothetical protein